MIIADLHIHTKYSQDSLLEPRTIIKTAEKQGLNTIAITDHNTIRGALATLKIAPLSTNITIIPGVEMRILNHDIICLFITEQPKRINNYSEFLDHAKDLGALTILAHPYRKRKPIPKELAQKVDLIETLNARTPHKANLKAQKLAHNLHKHGTAGSDAHLALEIGKARTIIPQTAYNLEEIRKALLKDKKILIGKESPLLVHLATITIEAYKKLTKQNQ